MAAIEPAKAPPLYEPGGAKSTAVGRLIGDRAELWHSMAMTMIVPLVAALALALGACHSEETRNRIAAAENGSQPLEADAAAQNGAQPQ